MLSCQCSNADFYTSICRLKPGLIGITKGKDYPLSLLLPEVNRFRIGILAGLFSKLLFDFQ